ncbi:Transglutaminase-like superfamily protein [Ruminococcus sp. YE71]|uniref:transglutaminase-like domain-containing protein n=1 Tax=unclassified Ruminococcus TaxID=2608920 RepID=UPI0008831450|nr:MULTISPECIES: transglutaminase-like domain-containing protein [unclassified Ruminococcus]SDA15932.1 Transglutaminase-like superfamily protein [Ruminococcus sp. YE78]SFW23499.1 Transglutaminase-like superfamily protein [Ruminococcus sp. YE71]
MFKKEKKTKTKQEKPKRPLAETVSSYFCPMLLGGVLCFSVYYALYRPFVPFMTVMFMLVQLGLFLFFDKIKDKKIIGGIIYCAILFLVVNASVMLMWSGIVSDYTEPVSWFYGEDGSYSYRPEFIWAVFLGGGFFLISVLYYFTQIRYRSLGSMLCLMFPFVIYAKRAEEMPEIVVTLIITSFLAVMVHNRRVDPAIPPKDRGRIKIDRSYLISIAIFVSVTGAVTMMIKKPTYRSKLEQDSNFFNYVDTQATGSGDDNSISPESSARSTPPAYTGRQIFSFKTEGDREEYFLRIQPFDNFDGDKWKYTMNDSDFALAYSSVVPEYGVDDILKDAAALGLSVPDGLPHRTTGIVYDETFAPEYLPAPLNTITDDEDFTGLDYYKFPKSVIIRRASRNAEPNPPLNDTFVYNDTDADMYMYVSSLGLSAADLYDPKYDGEAADRLRADYETACDSYMALSGVSDRLAELSFELTKDAKSDYQKAKILETWFEETGFEYSLEYVPEDTSIDYFVFESKTGYCTNFATAMTLMARAAGLPARYVEGFAAFERADDGSFIIRDSCAHAFVEVYIAGAGWMTFDPTVPGYMQIPKQDDNFSAAAFLRILSRFLIVIIVAFVVIFVLLLDRIVELILRIRLRMKSPAERTLMLYRNIIKLVNLSTGSDYSAYTVKMLRTYLNETRAAVPEKLLRLFERVCFGGHTPTEEEFAEAYDEYKRCYKYLRKIPKPKTLEKLRAVQ